MQQSFPTAVDAARIVPEAAVSILMPIRNERESIEEVLAEWEHEVLQYLPSGSEIVFDDGFSDDGTYDFLLEQNRRNSQIRVIRGEKLDGFGNAAKRLYYAARNPLIFFTDSDGQYVAADFWKLTPYIAQFDLVHGYKGERIDPLYRKIASYGFNKLVRWMFSTRFHDINSAFRLMKRDSVLMILPQTRHLTTLVNAELLLRTLSQGAPIYELSISHRNRLKGVSRGLPWSSFRRECWRTWCGLWKLRRELRRSVSS